jgi:enterobactin synthetase component F
MNLATDPDVNVFSLFSSIADASPEKIAVIDADGETTYGALLERAGAIARSLLSRGIEPEEPVGVIMRRRAELIAVLLGIWQAGGSYVPFDHDDPPDRILRMLASSGCRRVLGDRSQLDILSAAKTPSDSWYVLFEPVDEIGGDGSDDSQLPVAPGGSRLAYLLFTSGSTGEPKAVEVEHRNVLALLDAARQLINFSTEDRYLAISTIAFDASITELFIPLTIGASLVLCDRSLLLEPRRLAEEIRNHGVTVFQTGPAVWSVILERYPDFPKVRVAITHGEAVAPQLAARICLYGHATWNLYGPTETTVWACGHPLSAGRLTSISSMSAPIGRPLPHVRATVMDSDCKPISEGKMGELWINGPGVARGYRGKPELTAERFVDIDGIRHYRTGDIVQCDADGVLHYFGRHDDQMKIRGVRIEPGEVEAAVLKHEGVAEVAVTWIEVQPGRKAIIAAVVLKPGISCTEDQLHVAVSTRIPRQMIPSRYVFVPWLPMTTSGKIDRRALRDSVSTIPPGRELFQDRPVGSRRPLRSAEAAIAHIWKNVLQIDEVGPNTNFFLSGGDSLSAVQMLLEVEHQFGIELPAHLAFELPTLAELATRVERAISKTQDDLGSGYIFPIAEDGDGPPLFFCHVDLLLARRGGWTAPCPLFAIVYWARGSGLIKAQSIPELASQHIESMRAIQAHGPYRLAGYSLGGMIAYEMAQQLRRSGESVDILFLLDPLEPKNRFTANSRTLVTVATKLHLRLWSRLRRIGRGPEGLPWKDWLAGVVSLPWEWHVYSPVHWLHYYLVDQHLRSPNWASQLLFPKDRWRAFSLSARRIMNDYVADQYEGKAVLITAQDHVPRTDTWHRLLPQDTVSQTLPFGHLELFRQPALRKWLEVLTLELQKVSGGRAAEADQLLEDGRIPGSS